MSVTILLVLEQKILYRCLIWSKSLLDPQNNGHILLSIDPGWVGSTES